jgi:outer membrane protein assembly factor BamA
MPRIVVAVFLAILLGTPSLAASQTACEKQFVVSRVTVPMTSRLTPEEEAAIRTRLIGRCFDDVNDEELRDRVRDALQNFGYFRATISEPSVKVLDFSRYPQTIALNIRFTEGPQYRVREIAWHGIYAVSMDQILSVSQVRPEDILDTSKVRELLEAVRRLYIAIGYPNVTIVPQIQVHEAGHWVSLNFSIYEGARAR